jgi:tetratricopeptide (TPR) repeat protein
LLSGTNKSGRDASQGPRTPAWLWLVLIGGFAFIFWQYVPSRPGPKPAPAPTSWIWVLIFVAAPVVVILVAVAWQLVRNFDPGVRRAEKRAAEGDLDGAIADLREQIEQKRPTQNRINALGILLMRRERWDEAAAMFRKAEEIGEFNKGGCRANLGLALLKGGKPAEAISVLQESARIGPQAPVLTCVVNLHIAMALAELLRWDEAGDQFRRAEDAVRGLSQAQRASLERDLEQCRQKLAQRSQEKPKPEGLAERVNESGAQCRGTGHE